QLMVDQVVGLSGTSGVTITFVSSRIGEVSQPRGFGVTVGNGKRRQVRRHEVEIERALLSDLNRVVERMRPVVVQGVHFFARSQDGGRRGKPPFHVLKGSTGTG